MEFLLVLVLILFAGGLLAIFLIRRNEFRFEPESILKIVAPMILPGGEAQTTGGAREIVRLLKNRVDLSDAEKIFTHKASVFFFERFDPSNDDLRTHLKNNDPVNLNYFDKIELYDFFVDENERLKKHSWTMGFLVGEITPGKGDLRAHVRVIDGNDVLMEILGSRGPFQSEKALEGLRSGLPDSVLHLLKTIAKTGRSTQMEFRLDATGKRYLLAAYSPKKYRFIMFLQALDSKKTA